MFQTRISSQCNEICSQRHRSHRVSCSLHSDELCVWAAMSNQHLKIPGQLGRKKIVLVDRRLLKIIFLPYSYH